MHTLLRLLGPRRRKNQEDIAGRAAEVIAHVLFDVGLERFLAGSVLLDSRFRLRFYAVPPNRPPPSWPVSPFTSSMKRACSGPR